MTSTQQIWGTHKKEQRQVAMTSQENSSPPTGPRVRGLWEQEAGSKEGGRGSVLGGERGFQESKKLEGITEGRGGGSGCFADD